MKNTIGRSICCWIFLIVFLCGALATFSACDSKTDEELREIEDNLLDAQSTLSFALDNCEALRMELRRYETVERPSVILLDELRSQIEEAKYRVDIAQELLWDIRKRNAY